MSVPLFDPSVSPESQISPTTESAMRQHYLGVMAGQQVHFDCSQVQAIYHTGSRAVVQGDLMTAMDAKELLQRRSWSIRQHLVHARLGREIHSEFLRQFVL